VIINDLILYKTIPNLTDGKSYLLPLGSDPGKVKQKENRAQNKIKRTERTLKILNVRLLSVQVMTGSLSSVPALETVTLDRLQSVLSSVTTGRVWLIFNARKFV